VTGASTGDAPASSSTRVMTLRLDPDLADLVDLLAAVTGASASHVIRSAIRTYARDIRQSPMFQELAARHLARQQWLLMDAGPVDPWASGEPDEADLA
jgi:predicted transcriptional regulator